MSTLPKDENRSTLPLRKITKNTELATSLENRAKEDELKDDIYKEKVEENKVEVNTMTEGNRTSEKDEEVQEKSSPFNTILKEILEESLNVPNCDNIATADNDTGQICADSNCTQSFNLTNCAWNTTDYNASDCCVTKVIIQTEPTQLGKNTTYRTIFYWFSSVSFAFLPLILIATINCFLVNAVRKSQKERKKMTKSQVFCCVYCVMGCGP